MVGKRRPCARSGGARALIPDDRQWKKSAAPCVEGLRILARRSGSAEEDGRIYSSAPPCDPLKLALRILPADAALQLERLGVGKRQVGAEGAIR